MPVTSRIWDTSVIIDYLEGTERAREHVPLIISEAERGETRILVSAYAEVEVVRLGSALTDAEEAMIQEFFRRSYVYRCQLDSRTAEIARHITRLSSTDNHVRTVKPGDAVHIATALRWNIPVFEAFDDELLSGVNAAPQILPGALTLRRPQYEGQVRADDLLR